jgi:G:T/U-mismatch repair DNA glycosylase
MTRLTNKTTPTIKSEQHPDWHFDIPEMKVLILGNFPPVEKRWSYRFYYPNKVNHFWKILAHIAKRPLQYFEGEAAVQERKNLMLYLKVGVENLGQTILRKGESSLDTNIEIKAYRDILGTIKKHPELETILMPGFHASSSTAQTFLKYLKEKQMLHTKPAKVRPGNPFEIFIDKRTIHCEILYSTSTMWKKNYESLVPQFLPFIKA